MSYHCTLHVIYWGDEKYPIPDYFDLQDVVCRRDCVTEKYISKKYASLDEMLKDYRNALLITHQQPAPNFYFNDIRLPYCLDLYNCYIKQLE